MNSIPLFKLIVLVAGFGIVSPLIAGSQSTGVQTIEGGPVSAGVQNSGPPAPTNPVGAARSDYGAQSNPQGNGATSAPGGSSYGRDTAASSTSAATGPGQLREKI